MAIVKQKYENIQEEDRPNFVPTQHLPTKIKDAFPEKVQIINIQNKKVFAPSEYTILNGVDFMKKMQETCNT